ncbi:MAG: HD-GYP domain-containing protein [Treponema sp.]|nr:HD-GYP domain-containing protein [Treponema sp.]
MKRQSGFFCSLLDEVKSMRLLTWVMFFVTLALYFVMVPFTTRFAHSREMVVVLQGRIPLSAFAGVLSSISNIVLIFLVVFFGKLGFCTCMGITVVRLIRLAQGIFIRHNIPSLPGTFIALTSIIAVILIYRKNQTLDRVQEEKLALMKAEQEHLSQLFTETARALATAIDAKDRYTHGHSNRVAEYSKEIAKRAGKSDKEIREVYFAALLHDVGKIGVSGNIINKKGKLTPDEFDEIKKHTVWGWEILSNITRSPYLNIGAHYHHEKFDGHGYPEGLCGDDIPDLARIISVADAYDAMTSNRSYRETMSQDVVRREIEKGLGSQFDPKYAKIMLEMIDEDKEYKMKE